MLKDSPTIEKHIEQLIRKTENVKQITLSEKQKEIIKRLVHSKCKPDSELQQCIITNQGPGKKDSRQPIYKVINFAIGPKKPIMSCYGTFFAQHGEVPNYTSEVVDNLVSSRKKIKNEMFTYPENSDEFSVLDKKQKVYKVMGNSFYGVLCQSAFILFNKLMGPSVTYQGVGIITSAIMAMEAYLGNNIRFRTYDDILTFVSNVCGEKNTNKVNLNLILDKDKIKSKNDLIKYLIELSDFSLTIEEKEQLVRIVSNLSISMVNRIYYKRNMEGLFLHDKIMAKFMACMPKGDDVFANVHKPFDYHAEALKDLYNILDEIVAYKYAYHDREQRAHTMKRKSVVIVDTDSTFLYLDPMYRLISKYLGKTEDEMQNDSYRINVCNVLTYFCSNYIQCMLDVFTHNCNIGKEKQPLINMKSEFLMKRVLLTKNKKQYASIVLVQEGNVYEEPALDLKGMSIRKVSVNKATREYFTDVINHHILTAQKIELTNILYKFYKYEQDLKDGLSGAKLDYLLPAKYGTESTYKVPAQIAAVRGVKSWNALYPDEFIGEHEKVRIVRTNVTNVEQFGDDVPQEVKDTIQRIHFNNKDMGHFPFLLSIPLTVEKVPDWITNYIAMDEMVATNLTTAMPIIETLGFEVISYKTKKYFTNIVPM